MIRIAIGLAAVFLLVPATARGEESTAEKVERLEKALEEQKQHYENEIGGLRRRIDDLEGRSGESELDRVIREMELEAETAIEEGTMGPTAAPAQTLKNAFNPRITMFGDFTARLDDRAVFSEGHHHGHEEEEEHEGEEHEEEEGARADDRAALRSFEIDARADIDPFAKAVVVLGIHEEEPGGEYGVETEELYATFETLPWRLRAKVGKFRASMGTINRLHMHDLPQTTAPLVVTEWFGAEGLNVTGAEVSWLAPETFVDSLEITLGVMNGEEDLLGNEDAQDPSWLGRIQLFEEASDSTWFQVGSSHHLGWTDRSSENLSRISGIDLLYRWRPKRRMDSVGPSMVAGGKVAFTRLPSASRASPRGLPSSIRRPIRPAIRPMIRTR